MRWSTRVLLSSLAAVLVPLLVLTAVGVPSIADRFSQSTEAALQGSVRAVAALVASGLEDLRREARLLARDPTIVQGVVKSDWATLARAASPRMLSLTLDGVADLIVVVDERGAPLVRVPASADAPSLSLLAGSADAVAAVRVVSGVPMLLAAAPVVNDGRALGTVVVGRRLEAIGRRLGANSFPMELVFLAGGEPAYTTLSAGAAGVRWADAAPAGRVEVSGTSYLMRSVGRWPDGTLWLLASDADARATQGLLWTWVAGFVLFAALATFAATWILTRRVLQPIEALGEGARRVAGGDFDARVPVPLGREAELGDVARAFNEMSDSLQRWRGEVGHRNRELEALNAVALTVNRTLDLIPTAEETLEVVRRVAEMDVAALYQAEEGGERLLLIAQRGLSPELAEQVRVRPIEGSQLGKAVRTGRPTVTRGLPSLAGADGALQTELALPIPVKGEVWGVMALVSSASREFSPEAMQLMEAVAYQVGVAVERASLFAETREKGQRLESLVGLAQTVTSSLDLSQVLDGVVQAAAGLIPDASVRLWIAEEDRLVLRVEGGIAGTAFGGRRTVFAVGEGLAGQVAETREPLVVERVVEDPRTVNVEWMRQEGYVSFVGVPLLFQNRLLGVLAILTRRLHRPTKEELELLVSFATQAAISIENARLYNEASRSAAEHQALLEVGGLVGSTLKVERVLDLIVERARALLGVRSAGIFKLDPSAGVLAYERGIGLSPEFIRSLRVPLGEGTSGKAIRYRAPAWTPDILNDTAVVLNDETRALVSREGYRAVLSVPILIKNEPYGVLAVYWWEPHSPTFSEVRLLSALAGQAAVALDNARLYEAATRRGKRLETLGELTRTLTATLSVEEVLKRVVKSAVELFGSSVSRLWLVDEDGETLSLRAHAGSVSPLTGVTRLRIGEGIVGRIVATRTAIVIPDLREDPRVVNRDRHRAEGVISQAGAPLLLGDRALGALSVAVRHAHEFSEEEVALLQSLAHHAAIALENARLFALEQSRRAQVEALVEIERELTAELNPERLLDLIIQRAGALLEARGIVFLLDEASRTLVPKSWYAMPPQIRDFRIPLGVGMAGTAAAERRGLLVNDFSSTAYAASLVEHGIPLLGSGHAMAQPFVSHDRLLGVITMSREEGGPRFTEGDLETFGSFATQATIALENARLYREAREHVERLAATQDQLIRTEKLRALGEMASGVAHDFNNLLASILGRAQLLMRRVEDPKLRQWLQVIERAAMDGARTVRRIQEFARIRRDQPFVTVDLNRVVQDALEVTQARWQEDAQSRGVTIYVATDLVPVPAVSGDPAELREVLTNLILNAVDAMPEGGTLTLATRADETTVSLTVHDSGVGMTPDVQPRIFDPFFTTKGPSGTGLGLSITYGIVSRHGGQIRVESAEGQGTTFHLTFSVSTVEAEPPGPAALEPVAPLRCLVVDDEQPVLEVLGDVLAAGGHSAVLVADGAEAIRRFKAEPFDIVFTDLAMPGVNGWQVARAVKDQAPSVPVLLVTGWGVELSPDELRGKGIDAVLSKPVKFEDILAAVAAFAPRRAEGGTAA